MEPVPLFRKKLSDDKFLNALAEAYRLQEAIIHATELAIISTTTEGIITSFNHAAEKLLGYTAEEMIGRFTADIFHDVNEINARAAELSRELGTTVQPGFETFIAKAQQKDSADRREWTYVRKDGTRFPVMLSISALWDERDVLIGYAGIATDITEQKNIEKKIRDSEAHLHVLLASIDDIAFEIDRQGYYTNVWTKKEHLLFVRPRQQYVGKHIREVLPEALFPLVEKAIRLVFHARESQYLEYPSVQPGRWSSSKISYIDDTKVLVLVRDITERKEAEEALQRMADENQRIFNNSLGLNCVATYEGYFVKLNKAWQRTMGWTIDELKTERFITFVHPDDVAKTVESYKSIMAGNDVVAFENRYRCKDGGYRWLLWTSSPDTERRIVYASAVDITERKKSEDELLRSKTNLEVAATELQEQNRVLDEFAHITSHNLRSPIGNISALIGLLNNDSTIEEYKVIFEKLKNVSANLSQTMNELMETLRVKKNVDVEIVEIRFKDMLDKVIQSLEGDLIRHEASITYDFQTAPKINYSRMYLESIFQNLLSNAIKYRSDQRQPEVHVSTALADGRIELRVRDNGLGIDMERFGEKLFGLHKTFHEHHEARGVGLFLTRTQIEAMGGSIEAESEVDVGTTFIVRF